MNPKQIKHISVLLIVLFSLMAVSVAAAKDYFPVKTSIQYARGFTIEYHDTYKIITVLDLRKNADVMSQYVLVQRGTEPPSGYDNTLHIDIPVRSLVTMSSTYLPHLEQLNVLDTLVGHDNFKHVNTPAVRERIAKGNLKEIGEGPNVNIELLMILEPDIIMTHMDSSMYDTPPKLFEAGLRVVINASFNELTPLGRMEWIKFIAAFFNKEQEAEVIFKKTANAYEKLAANVRSVAIKPTVLLNAPYKGEWWIPGGQSYVATFMKDAGATYLWAEDPSQGSHILDFEVVYEKAVDADYWLNPGQWKSLKDGIAMDERFAQFQAFQQGNVYNNNARVNEYGGNDYWESGLARPELVLADLIKIFHPELMPEHEFVYYKQLK
jgi:iron complex transport system substrate-binding protein